MEWIKCSERLPEVSGEYQVYHSWGGQSLVEYSVKHGAWNANDWNTRNPENDFTDVTHWMPLPEPPPDVPETDFGDTPKPSDL